MGRADAVKCKTARGGDPTLIEALVLDRLRALLSSRTDVSETLAPLDLDGYALDAALRKALKLSERWLAMPPVELKSLVQEIVDRITVAADRIEIQLSRAKIAAALQVGERGQRPDLDPVDLSIEAKVRRAGKGKRLVIGNCQLGSIQVRLLARRIRARPHVRNGVEPIRDEYLAAGNF
jgi:site-specific DNA recombinase